MRHCGKYLFLVAVAEMREIEGLVCEGSRESSRGVEDLRPRYG